jgi:Zn-dependent protease/CBS domain-containing protein
MRWSWKIAEIGGIAVHVHATFAILLAWVAVSFWSEQPSVIFVLSGLAFVLSLFVCVTLHEFGHALTAKRFGIRTRDITLLPIGGLARAERIPSDPRQELAITLAGPAVTLLIAAALFLGLRLSGTWEPVTVVTMTSGPFAERLMLVNLGLAAFNMLPAFPMDGGRVLRALLALRLNHTRATVIAARLGQALAFGFGILGLLANPVLFFVALFVWMGAAQESAVAQMAATLSGVPVRRVMRTEFHALSPDDSLAQAAELLLRGSQPVFPILDDGRVAGMLTKPDIVRGLSRHGERAPIATAMRPDVLVVDASDMLDEAFQRLQGSPGAVAAVTDRGRFVGLLAADTLEDFVRLQAARRLQS